MKLPKQGLRQTPEMISIVCGNCDQSLLCKGDNVLPETCQRFKERIQELIDQDLIIDDPIV